MQQQPTLPDDLFSLPPNVAEHDMALEPRARATDPATSHHAATRAKAFAWSHRDRILGALWRPMIPPEIARLTGLSIVQVDRRRKELLEAGDVTLTGQERDGFEEWTRVLPDVEP